MGLIIQTSPDSLNVLNEFNTFDAVKLIDVSKRIVMTRNSTGVDSENNVISRGTLIKIKDRNDPLRGQLGEIKCIFRNILFVWIKNSLLVKSNGFYCVKVNNVVNAGAKHLIQANEAAGFITNENQAVPDRNKRDSLLRNHAVIITRGPLKGHRGTVISANETFAEVHVHSKCEKFAISRADLQVLFNAMQGMRVEAGANVPVHLSFDEAANQEYVNVQDQEGGFAPQWGTRINENTNKDFGD